MTIVISITRASSGIISTTTIVWTIMVCTIIPTTIMISRHVVRVELILLIVSLKPARHTFNFVTYVVNFGSKEDSLTYSDVLSLDKMNVKNWNNISG